VSEWDFLCGLEGQELFGSMIRKNYNAYYRALYQRWKNERWKNIWNKNREKNFEIYCQKME